MIKVNPFSPSLHPVIKPVQGDSSVDLLSVTSGKPLLTPAHEPVSPLEDSQEEISMTFAEHMERKTKAQAKRQLNNRNRTQQHVERIEQLQTLFGLLESPEDGRLEERTRMMHTLLMHQSDPDSAQLIHAAQGDAARCDLVLNMLLHQARQSQDESLVARIERSQIRLNQSHGEEVRAGLNTADAVAEFTTDPSQKQAIRQLYYKNIVHLQSGHAMLDTLLQHLSPHHFRIGLRTLQRALADDLAAYNSSISRQSLRRIITSLHDAGNISHTLEISHSLLTGLKHKLQANRLSALELTRRLISLSGNGAYLRDLNHLAQEVAGPQPDLQERFFSALLPLLRQLPRGLWRDEKNRQTALNLLSNAISGHNAQAAKLTFERRNSWVV